MPLARPPEIVECFDDRIHRGCSLDFVEAFAVPVPVGQGRRDRGRRGTRSKGSFSADGLAALGRFRNLREILPGFTI